MPRRPARWPASLDLDLFRQDAPRGLGVLVRQFRWRAPALRYAIRLALAMTTGLALTLIFPRFAHANWVLLTIALIMRANYSVTRQRRWDRVTGTLIGCALAVTFINTLPPPVLLLLIVLAVGTSHAYGLVAYRITAIGASVSSLLLLHFVDPLVHPQFFERIVDTLIGAGPVLGLQLSSAQLGTQRPAAHGARLVGGRCGFADAALTRAPMSPALPPGAQEGAGRGGATVRRHPAAGGRAQHQPPRPGVAGRVAGGQLSAGVGSVVHAGAGETAGAGAGCRQPPMPPSLRHANGWWRCSNPTAEAALLSWPRRSGTVSQAMHGSAAMDVLARRLDHIEHAAEKVARLAARPVIEDV